MDNAQQQVPEPGPAQVKSAGEVAGSHEPTGVAIVLSHGSSFRGIRLAERAVRVLGASVRIG